MHFIPSSHVIFLLFSTLTYCYACITQLGGFSPRSVFFASPDRPIQYLSPTYTSQEPTFYYPHYDNMNHRGLEFPLREIFSQAAPYPFSLPLGILGSGLSGAARNIGQDYLEPLVRPLGNLALPFLPDGRMRTRIRRNANEELYEKEYKNLGNENEETENISEEETVEIVANSEEEKNEIDDDALRLIRNINEEELKDTNIKSRKRQNINQADKFDEWVLNAEVKANNKENLSTKRLRRNIRAINKAQEEPLKEEKEEILPFDGNSEVEPSQKKIRSYTDACPLCGSHDSCKCKEKPLARKCKKVSKMMKECRPVHKMEQICENIPRVFTECGDINKMVTECQRVPKMFLKCENKCQQVPIYVTECHQVPKTVKECHKVTKLQELCRNVPRTVEECHQVPKFFVECLHVPFSHDHHEVDEEYTNLQTSSSSCIHGFSGTCPLCELFSHAKSSPLHKLKNNLLPFPPQICSCNSKPCLCPHVHRERE